MAKVPYLNKAGHFNKGKNNENFGKFTKNPTCHDELEWKAFFLFFLFIFNFYFIIIHDAKKTPFLAVKSPLKYILWI